MKSEVEKKIAYNFKNPLLLEEALTHSSSNIFLPDGRRMDNERLEFIGDALLDAVVGIRLYEELPYASEGKLTRLRSQIVCEESLAKIGSDLSLGSFLRIGKGEKRNKKRGQTSLIADAVEAIIGAVYLDSGYEAAENFIIRIFADPIRLAPEGKLFSDYKSRLQEKVMASEEKQKIEYIVDREEGPDHDKEFFVHVELGGNSLGRGSGRTKKEAEQKAAEEALQKV
jgi:ribonuclease-3